MLVSWSDIKSLIDSNQARMNYINRANEYFIVASSVSIAFECAISKGTAEATEFEENYKETKTNLVEPIDSDGSRIQRSKTTKSGWHYEPRSLDFITAKASSLYNRKHDGNTIDTGTDYGDAAMFFFDASGNALVKGALSDSEYQDLLTANCVRTHIDWQPQYEMEIIGATVSLLNPPTGTERAYIWVIVAPEVPANLGGQVPFMSGGWNGRFFASTGSGTTFLDGRGIKYFAYDPVYNSNKFRVVVKHELGAQIEMQFVAEHFKA